MVAIIKESEDLYTLIDPFFLGFWHLNNTGLIIYLSTLDLILTLKKYNITHNDIDFISKEVKKMLKDESIDELSQEEIRSYIKILIDYEVPLYAEFDPKLVLEEDKKITKGILNPPIPIIEITRKCNYSCPWCYVPGPAIKGSRDPIDLDALEKHLVEPLSKMGTLLWVISGGEPNLYPKLVKELALRIRENVRKYSTKPIQIMLLTNGWRLSELIQLYKDAGITNIQVSLASHIPEKDKILRRVPRGIDSVAEVIKGIKAAVACGIKVSVNVTIVGSRYGLPSNIEDLPYIAKLVKESGAYLLRLTPVVPSGKAGPGGWALSLSELKLIKEKIIEAREVTKATYVSRRYVYLDELSKSAFILYSPLDHEVPPDKPLICRAGTEVIYIDVDGNVYPCNNLIDEELKLGNIYNEPIVKIWREAPLLKIFRTPIKINDICAKCNYRSFCGGQCKAIVWHRYKQLTLESKPSKCFIDEKRESN